MTGTTIDFKTRVETDKDEMNNPVYTILNVEVPDCLIAPTTEPANVREQQAIDQVRDKVRVHFPKTFTTELGGSYFAWGGKIFKMDSTSVKLMDENTPTRWNRYTAAESVGRYDIDDPDTNIWLKFFSTEDGQKAFGTEDGEQIFINEGQEQ